MILSTSQSFIHSFGLCFHFVYIRIVCAAVCVCVFIWNLQIFPDFNSFQILLIFVVVTKAVIIVLSVNIRDSIRAHILFSFLFFL